MRVPHPIPYQGSKRLLASKILKYFPTDIGTLYEPFAGSAALTLACAVRGLAGSFAIADLNPALVGLWNSIINTPEATADKYAMIWKRQLEEDENYYYRVREQFNKTGAPELFLYLLVRCVKAAVRYNANGEFNQSYDKRRLGTKPEAMRKEIADASVVLAGKTECITGDYRDIISKATIKDLVYMDPPYQGVSSNRNSRYFEGLPVEEFIDSLDKLNTKNISYIVSYDGRTGNKFIGESLPAFLNLQHLEVAAGRSSQATLLGRDDYTYESLYLSPALWERLTLSADQKQRPIVAKQLEIAL